MVEGLQNLIRVVLFENLSGEDIDSYFPKEFHPRLKELIVSLIDYNREYWSKQCLQSQVRSHSSV